MKKIFSFLLFLTPLLFMAQFSATLDSIWVRSLDTNHIEVGVKASSTVNWEYELAFVQVLNDSIKIDLCYKIHESYYDNLPIYSFFPVSVEDEHQYTLFIRGYEFDWENYICFSGDDFIFGSAVINFGTPLASEIAVDPATLGLSGISATDIILSPNPVSDRLYIKNNSPAVIQHLSLYNAQGRLYKQLAVPDIPYFSVADLPAGLYFVRLYTDSGVLNKKILVRRD